MLDAKIYTFLKVAEWKSCTRAAAELHLTQPAVTQHIQRLEEHYGCKLVDFSGRQMRLTQAGLLMLRYAQLQLANEEKLLKQLSGVKETMRVGATLSIADYYLPGLMRKFLARRSEGLQIQVGNTWEMLEALRQGKLDCAFVEGIFDPSLFSCRVFQTACFLPVAQASHPLAGRMLRLEELYPYPLALREQGSGTRSILENHLYQKNTSKEAFASVLECGSFRMIKEILKQTQAVSFMYEEVAREEVESGALTYLTVSGCDIMRPLHFVTLKYGMGREACDAFYDKYIAGQAALTVEGTENKP